MNFRHAFRVLSCKTSKLSGSFLLVDVGVGAEDCLADCGEATVVEGEADVLGAARVISVCTKRGLWLKKEAGAV